MEVVVLSCSRVDGRGSRALGDGSGTCLLVVEHDDLERVLGNMHVVSSCTQLLSWYLLVDEHDASSWYLLVSVEAAKRSRT